METLALEVFIAVIILILYVLCAQYLQNYNCQFFHQSGIAIAFGAVAGIAFYYLGDKAEIDFSSQIFFYFVLPPIIFSAGYNLKSRRFFVNIGFITLFGLIGTFLSFVTLALLGLFFNYNGALDSENMLSTKDCLLLACVLSATDTVAAHSVVKEQKFPKLNSILFGEGVLNDAVSIVLFRTVANTGKEFGAWDSIILVFMFLYTTVASILIGAGMGFLMAWVVKRVKDLQQHPEREISLVILGGYAAYMISQLCNLSGIMTIFCCGLCSAHYTYHNLSSKSQQGTNLVLVVISQGAQAFTFTYLGMTIVMIPLANYNFLFILCMFVAMVLGRACSIFLSSAIVYTCQCGKIGFETNNMCVAWFSGLIRGAVAFALVLQIESEQKDVVISTTLAIAIFTTIILSTLLGPYTKFVGLEQDTQQIYHELVSATAATDDTIYSQHIEESGLSWFHRIWSRVDEKILTPYFGSERQDRNLSVWDKLWAEDGIEINRLEIKQDFC